MEDNANTGRSPWLMIVGLLLGVAVVAVVWSVWSRMLERNHAQPEGDTDTPQQPSPVPAEDGEASTPRESGSSRGYATSPARVQTAGTRSAVVDPAPTVTDEVTISNRVDAYLLAIRRRLIAAMLIIVAVSASFLAVHAQETLMGYGLIGLAIGSGLLAAWFLRFSIPERPWRLSRSEKVSI